MCTASYHQSKLNVYNIILHHLISYLSLTYLFSPASSPLLFLPFLCFSLFSFSVHQRSNLTLFLKSSSTKMSDFIFEDFLFSIILLYLLHCAHQTYFGVWSSCPFINLYLPYHALSFLLCLYILTHIGICFTCELCLELCLVKKEGSHGHGQRNKATFASSQVSLHFSEGFCGRLLS